MSRNWDTPPPAEPNPIDQFFRNVNSSKAVVVIAGLLIVLGLFSWISNTKERQDAYGDCLVEALYNDTPTHACQP